MIDYLLAFPNEADAKADKIVGAYATKGTDKIVGAYATADGWRGDVCIPDVKVTQVSTGKQLDGWYLNVSTTEPSKELIEHPACAFAFDRDAANAGGKFVMLTKHSAEDFADLAFSPQFAGSKVPERQDVMNKGADAKARGDLAVFAIKDDAVVGVEAVTTDAAAAKTVAASPTVKAK